MNSILVLSKIKKQLDQVLVEVDSLNVENKIFTSDKLVINNLIKDTQIELEELFKLNVTADECNGALKEEGHELS